MFFGVNDEFEPRQKQKPWNTKYYLDLSSSSSDSGFESDDYDSDFESDYYESEPDVSKIATEKELYEMMRGPSKSQSIKTLDGWKFTDVIGDGNCFYRAIAVVFNRLKFMGCAEWTHGELRRATNPNSMPCSDADEKDIIRFPRVYNVVLAIVSLSSGEEKACYRYYYTEDGFKTKETINSDKLPKSPPIVRIAYTGNHYMVVDTEPESKKPNRSIKCN